MADITSLQASLAALTAIVVQLPPVLQANTDLSTRIIAVLEDVLAQLKSATPTQADIDAMAASVNDALTQLGTDVTQVNATNTALQDEIARAVPPPVPPVA